MASNILSIYTQKLNTSLKKVGEIGRNSYLKVFSSKTTPIATANTPLQQAAAKAGTKKYF